MEEAEAIHRLKRGDISGLEALVCRYQVKALKASYLITGEKAMAEDIVQDAFLKAYERAGQFDGRRQFAPWFLRIVVNDSLKAVHKRNRHVRLDFGYEKKGVDALDLLPHPDRDTYEQMEKSELQQVVWEAIEKLSPSQRAIVVLKYYLGFTDTQIAKRQDLHPGTVKRQLHRAREKLRLLLSSVSFK